MKGRILLTLLGALAMGGPGQVARATPPSVFPAHVAPPDSFAVPALTRLASRAETLSERAAAAGQNARDLAWMVYRLNRRRQVGFLDRPAQRLPDARSLDLAVTVARRARDEARILFEESARAQSELAATEQQLARPPSLPAAGGPVTLIRPVRGPVVGLPGIHKDASTGVEQTTIGLQLLPRMNQPVLAPLAGVVHRKERLPQGGWALVIKSSQGVVTILSGLRQTDVLPGEAVAEGQPVGLAGRNLDGAPVLTIDVYRNLHPLPPSLLIWRSAP